MKKLLLAVGIIATMFACQQPQAQQTASTETVASAMKIAYINNDSLSTYYKFGEDKYNELQKKMEKAQKSLQTRAVKLQGEMQNFEKRARAGLMSQNDIRQKQEQLGLKQQELQAAQQSQAQGLQAEEIAIQTEVRKRVKEFLDNYSADKNYSIVLGYSDGVTSTVIWSTPNVEDITQDVIDGLNKIYEDEQNAQSSEEKGK
ncbi:OmpH family outer membrane protein [Flammeovirga yaeyamensis]|uniref:OmpH family outer membrane protein n=1 Tax=Flammeovirga yaeyamensis TaxID=367791 RepID=A0AAX1N440_9BACT|nr:MULTISPECIES: OmpH family outer membrane protein [Flammeovirga]ANQ50208.1 OmpH family outer membrane protein [Flammeovirga sp. MY04]MBB3699831.1 outer membrane protein [Flammeovirga yaeyamensis]NMF36600.1 OmpH family outer membrane protein [Flammeovirga yaeyamensis]QWG02353.1 OmpH family outer membrane protein [Flammeovirga yaeyamensis]